VTPTNLLGGAVVLGQSHTSLSRSQKIGFPKLSTEPLCNESPHSNTCCQHTTVCIQWVPPATTGCCSRYKCCSISQHPYSCPTTVTDITTRLHPQPNAAASILAAINVCLAGRHKLHAQAAAGGWDGRVAICQCLSHAPHRPQVAQKRQWAGIVTVIAPVPVQWTRHQHERTAGSSADLCYTSAKAFLAAYSCVAQRVLGRHK
jgi:hypothetical protein